MKNVKRLIAGLLAAVMMISSVQVSTVYAAEEVETEVEAEIGDVEEDKADADEAADDNDADVVEADDEDEVIETFKAIETVEDTDKVDIVSTDVDDRDNEVVISNEDVVETTIEDDETEIGDEASEIDDIEVVETEVAEYEADVKAAKSVDYDAVEEYIAKQLLAEKNKNPQAAEITVDISSYQMPYTSSEDGNKLSTVVNNVRDRLDLFFVKSYSRYADQKIFTRLVFSIDTTIDYAALQKELKVALATVNNNMSDFQKIVVLFDYVAAKCTYDKTTEHCSDIYGALIEGRVKCTGYAHTYKYLCDQVGIDCYLVTSDAANHMWNLVKLDGEYYHVDVTSASTHTNLLKSDAKLSETRRSDYVVYKKYGEYLDLKATSTKYDDAGWRYTQIPMTFENGIVKTDYTITYVLNGGRNNSKNPATYTIGTTVTFKNPIRDGYIFDGWYLDADFTSKVEKLLFNSSGDKTIYAKWVRPEGSEVYTLTYVLNGGTNSSSNPSCYIKGIGVTFEDPVKDGYEFDGWYIEPEFKTKVTSFSGAVSGNATLYAKWTKIETPAEEVYTITYVLNGGTNNSENPATYVKGTAVEFKAPTREGYEFDGWYLNANFTSKVSALSVNSSGNKTIYAKWTKIETTTEESSDIETTAEIETTTEETTETEESSEVEPSETTKEDETTPAEEIYTITYVLNGGVNNSENPATYTKGTEVQFKDATREGYTFDGWYLNANFTSKVTALSVYSSGDKTIYAKWIKNETPEAPKAYKVTFNTNGHGTAPAPLTNVEAGNTITSPTAPTADGYRFDGWFKNAACTKAWNFDTDTVQSNTTLYAKWTYVSTSDFNARAIADVTYTGNACKPEVSVYDEDTLLTAGKDYQVKYYNNVNANVGGVLKSDSFNTALPYVEIIGKGNYTGTVKVNFNILRASVSDENADITLKVTDRFTASNKAKKPFSSIKYVKAMKENVDFTLRLTTAEGKELSGAVIPAGLEGTFTLEIIGKGNYEGALERTIYVGASIPTNTKFTAATISVNGVTDKVYTGKALVQNEQLSYNGKQLVRGVDYAVSYTKNVNKGTATMTFKGLERAGFTGSFKKTFKITAADITSANYTENLSANYTKSGAKPAITLTNNGKRLVNGRDYTLSYTNNKEVGSGTVTVKGKGNYVGILTVPFSIVKADLNNLTVKTVSVAYDAKKAADYEYKPVIKLMDGKTALKAGVDYQIEYVNNTQAAYNEYGNSRMNAPQAVITAAEGSAYKLDGEIIIPLPVYQNKFTKNNVSVKIEASECVYTGRQVRPSVEVRFMGTVLTEGEDYMVSYGANNVSGKNKGAVTISGIGPNYGGDVVVKFDINRKQICY